MLYTISLTLVPFLLLRWVIQSELTLLWESSRHSLLRWAVVFVLKGNVLSKRSLVVSQSLSA